MKCKICNENTKIAFKAKILKKYEEELYECKSCGFLSVGKAFWLDEAYKEALNLSDTGIVSRNLYLYKIVCCIAYFVFAFRGGEEENKEIEEYKLLDFGAGSGLLVRLLRDIGIDAYFYDEYCKNIFARGFEWNEKQNIKLITSFEVFEHLENPKETILNMLDISPNILFSTELLPNPTPKKWWYYGFNHGQHISFYTKESLYFLAKERELNLYSMNNIHLISKEKINAMLLKMIIKFANRGLFSYVKTKLKSKTMKDYEMLQ